VGTHAELRCKVQLNSSKRGANESTQASKQASKQVRTRKTHTYTHINICGVYVSCVC
jgi:hypothetical protein